MAETDFKEIIIITITIQFVTGVICFLKVGGCTLSFLRAQGLQWMQQSQKMGVVASDR